MTRRFLLRLYPRLWRERYGEELSALLDDRPLSLAVALDMVRRAVDAHLHPELVAPSLAVSAGGTTFQLRPRSPLRLAVLAVLMLGALSTWSLAQPLPFVPLIVPIGAHASPEDFARSQVPSSLSVCITVEQDGLAGVFCANPSGTERSLVTAYRTSTLGWMGEGGGRAAGAAPSTDLPVTTGYSSGWSSASVGTNRTFGFVSVAGAVGREVGRVIVLFDDGSREVAQLRDGAYLWFTARWDLPATPGRPDLQTEWEQQSFGRAASTVIAYAADGRELARQDLRPAAAP